MITVQVKLFATLRRHYPNLGIGEPMAVDVPVGVDVGQLLERLSVPADEVKVVFVNHVIRNLTHTLADGDTVGLFPPVGGG